MIQRFVVRIVRIISKILREPIEVSVETAIWKYYGRLRVRRNPFIGQVNGIAAQVYHRGTRDDIMAIWQCFYKQQYEIPKPLFLPRYHGSQVQSFYEAIIASGRTPLIVDCGANIGASVAWFRARYPASHIVAVEPAAANLELLRRNVKGPSAEIVEGGIAAADGKMWLIDPFGSSLAYQTVSTPAGTNQVQPEISVFSIDTLLNRKPPKQFVPFVLKIDIEGAERQLFDTDQTIFRKFPVIILEPHDFMTPGQSTTASFLRFHAGEGRDFLYGHENIFSIDFGAMDSL